MPAHCISRVKIDKWHPVNWAIRDHWISAFRPGLFSNSPPYCLTFYFHYYCLFIHNWYCLCFLFFYVFFNNLLNSLWRINNLNSVKDALSDLIEFQHLFPLILSYRTPIHVFTINDPQCYCRWAIMISISILFPNDFELIDVFLGDRYVAK